MSQGRIILIGALVALAALLVAFGPAPDKQGTENTLVITQQNNPQSLDPAIIYQTEGWALLHGVHNALLGYKLVSGPEGNTLVPNIAEAMPTVTDGGKTYTFKVRKGVMFSPPTSREVKPSDFKYTYDRLAQMQTDGSGFFNKIVGFSKVYEAKKGSVKGVIADDKAGTVTFKLTQPDVTFLYSMAVNFSAAIPKGTPMHDMSQSGFMASTGPYMLESYRPGVRITLKRNPNYKPWSPNSPKGSYDRIEVKLGVNDDNAMTMIAQGKADVSLGPGIPRSKWGFFKNSKEWQPYIHIKAQSTLDYIWMNTKVAPFDNVKVRQALNWAIDRRALIKLSGGNGETSSSIMPSQLPGSTAPGVYDKQDVEKAKQLIKESGVKPGLKVTYWYENSPASKDKAQYLQDVLNKLGFDARTRPVDRSAYSELVRDPANKAQWGSGAWGADFPEGSNMFNVLAYMRSHSPYNYGRYDAMDDEVDRILAMSDLEERATAWGKLDDAMMAQDAPLAPYGNRVKRELLGKRVGNYVVHPVLDGLLVLLTVDGSGKNNSEMHAGEVGYDEDGNKAEEEAK